MKDELDPEVFGDLPPPDLEERPPAEEVYQPQYPLIQTLGTGPTGSIQLCADPYREGVQVVQRLINERTSRIIPDLVEHGFARLQGLVHPALVSVRDFGWEGSQVFLVREWIQGESFSQAVPKLRLKEILSVIRQLLQALDYLFSQNVFHLQLKPENLFIVSEKIGETQLKVSDFGLGEILHRALAGRKALVGTPPFTAPDYAAQPSPDTRADLYSVGVLCYWALSRQLPYSEADAIKIHQAQQISEPKPLEKIAKVPPKLSQWVQSLIQPAAKDRPRDPRTAYRDFLSATASMALGNPTFPPLIFSDPEQIFRRKFALKTFRRIVQMGKYWAIQGPPGMGKGYLARWFQRLLWANGKQAVLYDGRKIAQLRGETQGDAKESAFVLIDYGDQGPVPAWLEARAYPNVILFGENFPWAKKDPSWQVLNLDSLDESLLREIEAESFGGLSDAAHQALLTVHQGNPGELVRQTRALAKQGLILETGGKWALREEGLKTISQVRQGGALGQAVASLDPKVGRVLYMLSLVQAPMTAATIAENVDHDAEALYPFLLDWTRQEWLVRRIWWGQEFFQSQFPSPQALPEGISEEDIASWVLSLEQLGWYRRAKDLLERSFSPDKLQRNSELILTRCRLSGLSGDPQIIFQNITSTFVKELPLEQQGPAFEILGRGLMAVGKPEQAEASYKKAFAQYRAGQDLAGQVQVLMDLGGWYGESEDGERALKFFGQALAFAKKLPEGSPLLGQVFLEIGRFYQRVTDYPRAEENFTKSIEQFSHHRFDHLLAKAYQNFAGLLVRMGEFQQAENYAREAVAIASFKEDLETFGAACFTLSQIEEQKENPTGVLERLGEVIFATGRRPRDSLYGEALVRRAYFYEKNRQLDKAQKEAENLLALGHENQNELLKAQGYMIRGKVARRDLKKLEEGFTQFHMAQNIFARFPDHPNAWECDFEMGEIERNRGNSAKARSLYESALNRLNRYVSSLPQPAQESFLKDGKREQIEMALRWLR